MYILYICISNDLLYKHSEWYEQFKANETLNQVIEPKSDAVGCAGFQRGVLHS